MNVNVRRFDRRRVDVSDAAMRALQTIAYLDHLTAGEALDRLILDFLELQCDEVGEIGRAMPAPPTRPPAKVIDLETRRWRQRLAQVQEMRDIVQRSRALRKEAARLCERARSMRTRSRQRVREVDRLRLSSA